jgi:hypothetical protein
VAWPIDEFAIRLLTTARPEKEGAVTRSEARNGEGLTEMTLPTSLTEEESNLVARALR